VSSEPLFTTRHDPQHLNAAALLVMQVNGWTKLSKRYDIAAKILDLIEREATDGE
jgi:hypothetical protein